jgi:hypothetical protein
MKKTQKRSRLAGRGDGQTECKATASQARTEGAINALLIRQPAARAAAWSE